VPFNRDVFDRAVREVFAKGGFTPEMLADPAVRPLIEETYNALNGAVDTAIKTETPPELTAALQNNTFIFSGFKTYHSLSEVGLALTDTDGKVKPFDVFRRDVEAIDKKYNTNYLYAEYNHALHTSQMAVKWHDFMADGDRYNLQYRTVGDERVRSDHAALDNTTLPPSDEFWKFYLPPNGWNCRCTVEQVLRDDYPMSDPAVAKAAGDACTEEPKARIFRYNAGQEMTIFPRKHPYLPKGCDGCDKNKMFLAWGRDSSKCSACKQVFMQLTSHSRNMAREWLKQQNVEAREIHSSEIPEGYIYFGKKQCRDIICHCYFPDEVIVARRLLHDFPEKLTFIGSEDLVDKEGTDRKIARGIIRYDIYTFPVTLRENGIDVQKTCQLKCSVSKQGNKIEQKPYAIRII